MGGSCGKSSANIQQVANPTSSHHDNRNAEYTPYLAIENARNVNHKYAVFFQIIKDKKTGTGIRETYAYKSKIPEKELEMKRREFWETRVEGLPDMWQALRGACESSEINDSMAIINAAGLKLVSKSLQMAYDAQGYKYDVPIFCINPPTSYELKSETKVDKQNMKINTVNVKMRCAALGNDIQEQVQTDVVVLHLKERFRQKYNVDNVPTIEQLRFFYEGKELKNPNLVGEYGIEDNTVISVFITRAPK